MVGGEDGVQSEMPGIVMRRGPEGNAGDAGVYESTCFVCRQVRGTWRGDFPDPPWRVKRMGYGVEAEVAYIYQYFPQG